MKKYYNTRREALQAASSSREPDTHVYRMRPGTRHHDMFFVGSHMEYLNYAN